MCRRSKVIIRGKKKRLEEKRILNSLYWYTAKKIISDSSIPHNAFVFYFLQGLADSY
jgi:hypothetical protein